MVTSQRGWPVVTERLIIRAPTAADLEAMVARCGDGAVSHSVSDWGPRSADEVRKWMGQVLSGPTC